MLKQGFIYSLIRRLFDERRRKIGAEQTNLLSDDSGAIADSLDTSIG